MPKNDDNLITSPENGRDQSHNHDHTIAVSHLDLNWENRLQDFLLTDTKIGFKLHFICMKDIERSYEGVQHFNWVQSLSCPRSMHTGFVGKHNRGPIFEFMLF